MTEQANRIDWLERQLAEVRDFVARDQQRLQEQPNKFSIKLSLDSWQTHQEELQQELRQAKALLQHEVVELRLLGRRMDGSIPLKLLSKLADKFNSAIGHAAYHLRHGATPARGVPDDLASDMDLRLSGLALGSTRLLFAGSMTPDTAGDSPMEGALEQIFDVLSAPSAEKIRELVTVIGVPATRALSEMLGALERQDIGAELTWPAANSKVYRWGGSLEAVRVAHKKLSTFEAIKPEAVTLEGEVTDLKESGAIYIRGSGKKFKISYNKQQYHHIQQLSLGMQLSLKTMMYRRIDPLTDFEIATYKLVTED